VWVHVVSAATHRAFADPCEAHGVAEPDGAAERTSAQARGARRTTSMPGPRMATLELPHEAEGGDTVRLTDSQLGIAREEFLRTDPRRPAVEARTLPSPDGATVISPPPKAKRRR
jgi:hypothetical protein